MTDTKALFTCIEWFLIILLRVLGFVMVSPVFGRKGIPAPAKIGLSVALAYLVYSAGGVGGADALPDDLWVLAMVCIRETLMGMLLGFVTTLFFSAFHTAGQIVDMQMGLAMGSMYDPQMESQTSMTGSLLYAMAMLSFIRSGGHYTLIHILYEMFGVAPVLEGSIKASVANLLLGGFYCAFLFAVKMALPVMIVMLCCEFVMGVMVKFVPQMNVFVLGVPLKILVGMAVLYFIAAPLTGMFDGLFEQLFEYSRKVAADLI